MSDARSLVPVPAPGAPAIMLGEELSELEQAALSPRTKAIYESALRYLYSWHDARGLDVSDDSVADYLHERFHGRVRSLSRPGTFLKVASPATCALIVAAVVSEARLSGRASPVGARTRRTLGGIRRQGAGRSRGSVSGLRWSQVQHICNVALEGEPGLLELRDVALLQTMSDGLLRLSELTEIQVADIDTEADGSGRLFLARSKTDQEARGATIYLGPPTVEAINAWREAGAVRAGHLFRAMRRGGHVQPGGMSTVAARAIVKRRAAQAGIKAPRISGHSMRVGSAESLAEAGASLVAMQTAGRWQTASMPAHYAKNQLAGRGAIAKLKYKR